MTASIESFDAKGVLVDRQEFFEKSALLNKQFKSRVEAKNGFFGESVRIKDNGVVEKLYKDQDGHYHKEYYADDRLFQIKESLGDKKVATIDVDDHGNAYSRIVRQTVDHKAKIVESTLLPDTTIVKNNFTAQTDSYGRLVSTKVTDVKINNAARPDTTRYKNHDVYIQGDEVGHGIAHNLGGPTGAENLFAQNQHVNRSDFRRVESEVKSLVEQGKKVEYEVKANYVGSEKRPSSFEPKITVDGHDYELPDDLKKIYNDPDPSALKKVVADVGEKYGMAHETAVKSGLVASGITLAVSTVDNVSAYLDGEITAEEMVVDIVTETAAAGAIEYGAEFISTSVSRTMAKSSSALIQKVANSSMPAAVVSFAVESYDSVSAYAKGEIDGEELAYELGDNAASIAGAMHGASAGAAIGSVAGPVGIVAGSIVGGVVGAAVASEMYATAVELGAEGVELLAQKAEGLMQNTVDLIEQNVPDKLNEVKGAFSEYINKFELPFNI